MSCPNFYKVNARNYYVIEPTYVDEDGNKVRKGYYDFENDIESACYIGNARGFKQGGTYVPYMDAHPIMEKEIWQNYGKTEIGEFLFTKQIFINQGRYLGANFDWNFSICDCYGNKWDFCDFSSKESFISEIVKKWKLTAVDAWNEGLAKIHEKNVKKWLEKVVDEVLDETDNFCKELCDNEYICSGVFSNGEAIYTKVV